ncbi:Molybdopterin converting factor, small subunit [Paramicrobacterium humi]|uniref:Molybdopterin converting factor, small subunit n=1 Tax=Paramicrobacterium humi TaxID=640635 RepID=A0A1H4N1M1_9MICO|nr:MoaD/ThiS family protein [Microbacterium humi]SEB88502.1 Molybdopterin converting factor, small subunit [Microbacterium humi]
MRIRYFAGAADAAGREEGSLAGPITLGALRTALTAEHGAEFARVLGRCSLLVDGSRLTDDDTVPDAATVDVLPPFAGG